MRWLIFLAAVVVVGGFVYAGQRTGASESEPDLTTCERALALLSKGEREGFKVLFEQWPDKTETGNSTIQDLADAQTPAIRGQVKSLGDVLGIELVRREKVGSFLRRYTYVCKHARGMGRWTFTFYRPEDAWRFHGYDFNFDERSLFADCGHQFTLEDRAPVDVVRAEHYNTSEP